MCNTYKVESPSNMFQQIQYAFPFLTYVAYNFMLFITIVNMPWGHFHAFSCKMVVYVEFSFSRYLNSIGSFYINMYVVQFYAVYNHTKIVLGTK